MEPLTVKLFRVEVPFGPFGDMAGKLHMVEYRLGSDNGPVAFSISDVNLGAKNLRPWWRIGGGDFDYHSVGGATVAEAEHKLLQMIGVEP